MRSRRKGAEVRKVGVWQVALLAQLDLLGWQLRLRDGADAAMPASLKRQLQKSYKTSRASNATPPPALPEASTQGIESAVSSDSEEKDTPGTPPERNRVR